MHVKVLTDLLPEAEPVTLEAAAYYCKVDTGLAAGEGLLLESLVKTARQWAEEYTQRSFGPKTLQATVQRSNWRGPYGLPYGPNAVVTEVKDSAGAIVPLEEFSSTYYAEYLKGMSVNNTYKEDHGFGFGYDPAAFEETYTVTYTAGYAVAEVPAPVKLAILKTTLELYNNRENTVIGSIVAELPQDAKTMLNPYRAKVGII